MKWPTYTKSCRNDIDSVLKASAVSAYRSNRQWGVGPKAGSNVYQFERELEKAWSVKHCVAMNSGTVALTAAIKALELPPGSEILTTPFSFSATPASIVLAGHTPRFADVSPDHFCLDPESVKKSITRKTKAILNVDLFGYLPDYTKLKEFGLPIIQDNCQAAGAVRDGKHLHGDIAIGSGNGQKNLPVIEGGWAYTNDGKYADRMRHYISHGENFDKLEVGVNGRMHELCAILARHGLKDLDERNKRRRELAGIILGSSEQSHSYYCLPFLVKHKREQFAAACKARGLEIGCGYINPSLEKYAAFRRFIKHKLPVVTELSERTLCLIYNATPDKSLSWGRSIKRLLEEVTDEVL